jgi:two-component system, OmpR family, response regulator
MHTQYKLLIVEDDPIVQMTFQYFLSEVQHTADCVGTLEQAEIKLQSNRYDFIFMDIGLPDGNGLDFAENLLKSRAQEPQSIIIVSAYSSQDIQERIERLQCQQVVKPLSCQQFKSILSNGFKK